MRHPPYSNRGNAMLILLGLIVLLVGGILLVMGPLKEYGVLDKIFSEYQRNQRLSQIEKEFAPTAQRITHGFVRHRDDKYGRPNYVTIGFYLNDEQGNPVITHGTVKLKLTWSTGKGNLEWTYNSTQKITPSNILDTTEPKLEKYGPRFIALNPISTVGGQLGGPSKTTYNIDLQFTTPDDKTLKFSRTLRPQKWAEPRQAEDN